MIAQPFGGDAFRQWRIAQLVSQASSVGFRFRPGKNPQAEEPALLKTIKRVCASRLFPDAAHAMATGRVAIAFEKPSQGGVPVQVYGERPARVLADGTQYIRSASGEPYAALLCRFPICQFAATPRKMSHELA